MTENTQSSEGVIFPLVFYSTIWNKLFKNGPSKISGRQPLKNLKGYGLPKATGFCMRATLAFNGLMKT